MLTKLMCYHHGRTKFTTFCADELTQTKCFRHISLHLSTQFRIFCSQQLTFLLKFISVCCQLCLFQFQIKAARAAGLRCLLDGILIFNTCDSDEVCLAFIRSEIVKFALKSLNKIYQACFHLLFNFNYQLFLFNLATDDGNGGKRFC